MTKNLIKQMMKKVDEKSHILDSAALIEKINSGYIAKQEPKFTKKKTFAPSGLVYGHGECPRYWYLAFEGNIFESDNEPYDVANMTAGTMSHDRIQQAMLDSGVAKKFLDEKYFEETGKERDTTEFKVTHSDPPIFGWGDAMLEIENEEVVGEIKTMKSESFEYFKNKGEPADYHVKQLIIYMKVLGKAKGALIYENKNNHDLLVFPIEVTEQYKNWINTAFDWMKVVYKSWKDKQLPQKNYRTNSKICKGCPVKAVCALAEPGVVKIESLKGFDETV
jgi:CRISPR/Cas system-associated exonuclease Cas4 (RecB family)